MENDLTAVLSGTDVRLALMDRRSELIRLAAKLKSDVFDNQIADLDRALFVIDMAAQVTLSVKW